MYTLLGGLLAGILGGALRSVLDPDKIMAGGSCSGSFEGYATNTLLGLVGGLLVLFAGSAGGGVALLAVLSGYVLSDIVDSVCVMLLQQFGIQQKNKRRTL